MPHLRPTSIAALLLAITPVAAFSSCGFDYPTDRVNTIAGGMNNHDATIDVLGIRVLATAAGEGRLIGSLANNLPDDASLETVTGENVTADFEPIEVAGRTGLNLVTVPTITVTGDFTAGEVVPLTFGFSTGESVTLNAPVVKPCFQYSDVPEADAADTPASDEHEADSDEHSDGDATFNCSDDAPVPGGAH